MAAYDSTPDNSTPLEHMLTVTAYAAHVGVNHRTVRQWLSEGLLPTARQDSRRQWFIPADARRLEKAPGGHLEHAHTTPTGAQILEAVLTRPDGIPRAFVTVPEAAALLGRSVHAIHRDRAELRVSKGEHGRLEVPTYVIRKYLGL